MAPPKKKVSKSKRNMRRSHLAEKHTTTLATCPRCQEPKLPHRVCSSCGYYRNEEVVKKEQF